MIVVDGSALVDYLTRETEGEWVERQLLGDPDLGAPHLVDLETANALRLLVLHGRLDVARASAALNELPLIRLTRFPHTWLIERVWALRHNLSAYDAMYVALAEALQAPLLTTDRRLARTPGLPVEVVAP